MELPTQIQILFVFHFASKPIIVLSKTKLTVHKACLLYQFQVGIKTAETSCTICSEL